MKNDIYLENHIPKWILPTIIISQFCCTSLWFAGNAVMTDLTTAFGLGQQALGYLSSSVQFGFIMGTLVFAVLMIADRFSPSKVFCVSALIAAFCNIGMILENHVFLSLVTLRFFTGFFLAGIYPVGIKIAADYYEKGLGKSLGFLVGALVLGTAFPHFLKIFDNGFSWKWVFTITSCLSVIGGILLVALVPDGPFRTSGKGLKINAFFNVFKNKNFRAAAHGYFGHMWELYAFWVYVPVMLTTYITIYPGTKLNISLWSFIIIAIGCLTCIIGGYISKKLGAKRTALIVLSLSLFCCLLSPLFFLVDSSILFIAFLIFWGMVVIPDSPLLSSMVAKNAESESKGSAITIVNCIGFSITILSIQMLSFLIQVINPIYLYLFLVVGPIWGLYSLYKRKQMDILD